MCQSGSVEDHLREASVRNVSIIGLDSAKNVFQAHGADATDLSQTFRVLGLAYNRRKQIRRDDAMIEFKGSHFEREVILWGIRWYVAYPISYRQLKEMLEERGVEVDHSTLNLWVMKYVPLLDQQFRARKHPVGASWRLDET
jgi:hypothetical protein